MTLKEFAKALNVNRHVAARVAAMVSGAKKEAAGDGQIQRWVLPDDAISHVTEDMLEEAKEVAGSVAREEIPSPTRIVSPAPPPSDPALREEELAVQREELQTKKIQAETRRLQAEAERRKVQEELKAASRSGGDPVLAERLGRLEQRIEAALQRSDATATMVEVVKAITPVLTPLLERVTTPAPAAPAPDLLSLVEKVRALLPSPDTNLRREIRTAFQEGLEIGRERATVAGGGGSSWAETVQSILQGLAPALPALVEAAKRSGLTLPAPIIPALPSQNPGGNGGATVTETPTDPNVAAAVKAFQEVVDVFADEVKKPDRDLAGLAAFLESVVLDPVRGVTLLDRLIPIAQSPERLAQVSLKLFVPRLAEPDVWPGMQALFAHMRAETEKEEKGGEPR